MIDPRTYSVFVAAPLVAVVAPGPDIFYVLSRSLSAGKRIGFISAFAIATGSKALFQNPSILFLPIVHTMPAGHLHRGPAGG